MQLFFLNKIKYKLRNVFSIKIKKTLKKTHMKQSKINKKKKKMQI